ncbi:MAG: DUF4397 domain-containing protein [Rhodoglobus sp.]|nr:DUF4397 domain-containing protein [Rhodoglobus sp.]
MRYKILSGLAVGLLATVGVAAPAQAISASSSDVYVVHGIPGLTVDVYVNDALTLENFEFGTAAGPLDLAAGDYKIQVFEADADPATATPAINVPAASVPANESVSLVAQYDESGAPTLGVFINDISTIPAGQGRLTVRHTGEAGAVAIVANGAIAFDNVENGDEGTTLLPAGDITAGVAGAGTASPLVIPADGNAAPVTIVEGTNLIVYAVGASDSLQLITQSISGLHSTPGGVHSGTAGLAADANPTAIALGSAALLALLLAAALIGMGNRAAQSAGK